MTNSSDPVSRDLRNAECEIDKAYKSNMLTNEGFASSAWFLLAFAEDMIMKSMLKQEIKSIHEAEILADNSITHLRYPLYWLFKSCMTVGKMTFRFDGDRYQAAWNLLDLGEKYEPFIAAFTYASRGIIGLELHGNHIIPVHGYLVDTRYEAYNRLIKPSSDSSVAHGQDILGTVEKSLKVQGERFTYKLNPKIVDFARSTLQPMFDSLWILPSTWEFTRYSIQEFRSFYEVMVSIAIIHWCARYLAAINGCIGVGFVDSVCVFDRNELLQRVVRYSGLKEHVVREILGDLTYGSNDMRFPDPAIQPLIPLMDDRYAIMPWLWLGNSAERNLTVLLNKLPGEKQHYARLVNEKEKVLQQLMLSMWTDLPFRFYSGPIPGQASLPDIDMAVISDSEKACLLLELKWFIYPADIGEVIEKSEELRKGVSQLERLKQFSEQAFQPMLDVLDIDNSYTLCFAVASANWIGQVDVQSPNVAIIKADHIAQRIVGNRQLRPTMNWINERAYLPMDGKEYKVIETTSTIENWSLTWYGIKPLISGTFFPL